MDRRNGGGQLAPPRPPKLLPRVHRPRAPSPPIMNELSTEMSTAITTGSLTTSTSSISATARSFPIKISEIPQCTNNNNNNNNNTNVNNSSSNNKNNTSNNNNNNSNNINNNAIKNQRSLLCNFKEKHVAENQQEQQQLNSIRTSNNSAVQISSISTVTESAGSSLMPLLPTLVSSNSSSTKVLQTKQSVQSRSQISTEAGAPRIINTTSNTTLTSNTGSPYNAFIIDITQNVNAYLADAYDDYQIHHLTYLPQRPTLSRNTSNVSTTSTSSSVTPANSFIRRRSPVPSTNSGVTSSNTNNANSSSLLSSGLFSSFQNTDTAATAPLVTLAQPRPESERLTNEYVETPLRTTQQLLHVTRSVHPAGQNGDGQTTTHHPLLLPQREFRQQHYIHQQNTTQLIQHPSQSQLQFTNRLAGTAGSVSAIIGSGITDELLHSHSHLQLNLRQPDLQNANVNVSNISTKTPKTKVDLFPFPINGGEKLNSLPALCNELQPIEQPITKQPALTNNVVASNNCDFVKYGHSLGELLDLHPISANQGTVSTLSGNNAFGTPILVGSSSLLSNGTAMDLSSIICPQCHRCRCEQCKNPRPLPQTWIFNKKCLCSFETVTDCITCNCFAKACFYHCCRDSESYEEGNPNFDNPCTCYPYKRFKRFTLLGVLSAILPCLCLYWPLRGCGYLCSQCYSRCANRGCRCHSTTACMVPARSTSLNGNLINNNAGLSTDLSRLTNSRKGHQKLSTECVANRKQIKDDKAPEKRLLDSSAEY